MIIYICILRMEETNTHIHTITPHEKWLNTHTHTKESTRRCKDTLTSERRLVCICVLNLFVSNEKNIKMKFTMHLYIEWMEYDGWAL